MPLPVGVALAQGVEDGTPLVLLLALGVADSCTAGLRLRVAVGVCASD